MTPHSNETPLSPEGSPTTVVDDGGGVAKGNTRQKAPAKARAKAISGGRPKKPDAGEDRVDGDRAASEATHDSPLNETVNETVVLTPEAVVAAPNFGAFSLHPSVVEALAGKGITHPTPVQAATIPCFLEDKNLIALASTGSGKTIAFMAPLLTQLLKAPRKHRLVRGLILVPTRELALQVLTVFEQLTTELPSTSPLQAALIIGGEGMAAQERKLQQGVDVIIATPGRLMDMWGQGKLLLARVRYLVLDEADRMTDMGFYPDLRTIISLLPFPLHYSLFSATMPGPVGELINSFVAHPRVLKLHNPRETAVSIHQALAKVPLPTATLKKQKEYVSFVKRELLRYILLAENPESAIIFCNRKTDVAILQRSLARHGFSCVSLHGDMEQDKRFESLRAFTDGTNKILIASDVAARGLDIPNVSHVINYDIPKSQDDYIHRIGRTGRAGKSGKAITLSLSDSEVETLSTHVKRVIETYDLCGFETPSAQGGNRDARPPQRLAHDRSKDANPGSGRGSRDDGRGMRGGAKEHPGGHKQDKPLPPATPGFGEWIPAFMAATSPQRPTPRYTKPH